jgi:hypothetical protein
MPIEEHGSLYWYLHKRRQMTKDEFVPDDLKLEGVSNYHL